MSNNKANMMASNSGSTGGVPPPGGDLQLFLGLLEKDKALANKEFSPIRVFLLSGANVETIERVYNASSKSFDPDLIVEACRHGADKDVILFLATNLTKRSTKRLYAEQFLSACKFIKDPQVLEALRNITKADSYTIEPQRDWISGGGFQLSPVVDSDYISRVGMMLPVVKQLNIQKANNRAEETMFMLVQSMLSSKTLQSIDFSFPENFIGQHPAGKSSGFYSLASFLSNRQACLGSCGIEKIRMDLPPRQSNLNQALLVGLLHLPRLQELTIFYQDDSINEFLPILGQLVRRSMLKSLSIKPQHEWNKYCYTYGTRPPGGTNKFPTLDDGKICFPILDALKQNRHLESLVIRAFSANATTRTEEEIEDKLKSILQHDNATLTRFTLGFIQNVSGTRNMFGREETYYEYKMSARDSNGGLHMGCKIWDYYIALNKAGRAVARHFDQENFTQSIAKFVDLLAAVEESAGILYCDVKTEEGKERKAKAALNAAKIHYGLLRDIPGFWSNVELSQAASRRCIFSGRFYARNRKRKHKAKSK